MKGYKYRIFPTDEQKILMDLTLKDRVYVCAECVEVIDRDLNAAINILTVGRQSIRV